MTRRWIAWLVIAVVALTALGCSRFLPGSTGDTDDQTGISVGRAPGSKSVQPAPSEGAPRALSEDGAGTASGVKLRRMIVRDKYFQMEVKSVNAAYDDISRLAGRFGGYVVSSSIGPKDRGFPVPQPLSSQGADSGQEPGMMAPSPYGTPPAIIENKDTGPLAGTLVIKVPAARFEEAAAQVRKLGRVKLEQMSTGDVTEQFIDVTARIRTLNKEEQRYLDFLRAARGVSDMLRVERELTRIRGEIEQLQSQADYMKRSSALSTITVYAYEPASVVSPSGTDWGIVDAVTEGIRNFVRVVNVLIMLCGGLLPFLLIGLGLFYAGRWIWRRRGIRKETTEVPGVDRT